MEHRVHCYSTRVIWKGNKGAGTATYSGYSRSYIIQGRGKPIIYGSSDPSFRGDSNCWNPEELLLASLSACHQLWYLGLSSEAGVAVIGYEDEAVGEMVEYADGAGQFRLVVLKPKVILAMGSDVKRAEELHYVAHEKCFIARSVNFPIHLEPIISIGSSNQTP
ncbi:OsmC family protein [Pseudomonas glycinis]